MSGGETFARWRNRLPCSVIVGLESNALKNVVQGTDSILNDVASLHAQGLRTFLFMVQIVSQKEGWTHASLVMLYA